MTQRPVISHTANLSVTIGSGPYSGSTNTVTLRVEDYASGEVLADIDLTGEQLVSLLRGSTMTVDSKHTAHPERIGLQVKAETVTIPREAITTWKREEARAQAEAWVEEHLPELPAHDQRWVRSTNSGYEVVLRRFVQPGRS